MKVKTKKLKTLFDSLHTHYAMGDNIRTLYGRDFIEWTIVTKQGQCFLYGMETITKNSDEVVYGYYLEGGILKDRFL